MSYYYDSGSLNSENKYFRTNRLIVKTESNTRLLNYYGAVDVVEGYDGLHLLQYDNEYAADYAYNCLLNDDIECVEYDFYFSLSDDTQSTKLYNTVASDSWHSEFCEVEKALELLDNSALITNDVHIAVIDSGIYAEHSHFSVDKNISPRIQDSGYIYMK